MSFIGATDKGVTYAPGYFLAHGDEGVTRETKEFAQNSALVVTDENGGKHIPAGTAYPTNDGNAIGLTYEDVDVTVGDMPGSVITAGAEVYEDRLAITGMTYNAASDITSADDPATKGWYEKSGDTYSLSTDTVAVRTKTYYESDGESTPTYTPVDDVEYGDNPQKLGLYERSGSSPNYVYTLSTDIQADGAKTYYVGTPERLASAAKTALAALGFKFVATAPAVTRPY